ncbi:uncharacterized protein [Periplaneta americana]|uniref:uncharacterized protein n=1 Tax=Periplaneta americana TaxID=6978 RepID=UPI0037E83C7C
MRRHWHAAAVLVFAASLVLAASLDTGDREKSRFRRHDLSKLLKMKKQIIQRLLGSAESLLSIGAGALGKSLPISAGCCSPPAEHSPVYTPPPAKAPSPPAAYGPPAVPSPVYTPPLAKVPSPPAAYEPPAVHSPVYTPPLAKIPSPPAAYEAPAVPSPVYTPPLPNVPSPPASYGPPAF